MTNMFVIPYYLKMINELSIGALIMCKNEIKTLGITLESIRVAGIKTVILHDTGSTDGTVYFVREWCTNHNLNIHISDGDFVDFATSRNVSLDYAEKVNVEWLILFDASDQIIVHDSNGLVHCIKNLIESTPAAYVRQEWFWGETTVFFNIRLVKNKQGWRFVGAVHEYIRQPEQGPDPPRLEGVTLFQNRCGNCDSAKRFHRDVGLLHKMVIKCENEGTDPARWMYYLAGTYNCLGNNDESYKWYSRRWFNTGGFQEERFMSALRCGRIAKTRKPDSLWLTWFMLAYQLMPRAEPLVEIAEKFRMDSKWHQSYQFAQMARNIPYPIDASLDVEKECYDYTRHHLVGIVAWHYANTLVSRDAKSAIYAKGAEACKIACEFGHQIDLKNLSSYENE
jgi:glycosyltransferase involved in cell wall biosynthesis